MTNSTDPRDQGASARVVAGAATAPASDDVTAKARGFGRREAIGVVFVLAGLALVGLVAPHITSERRAFAFEPPPDPLRWEFSPPTVVTLVGVLYVLAGLLSALPSRFQRWSTRAQIASAAALIPLLLIIALGLSERSQTNVSVLFDESLILATPIALGAMTGLWCERSGIINIGIEGMMLAAAGVGFMSFAVLGDANGTGWLWLAVMVAVASGGLMALLHAVLCIRYGINQIISGVVINLFALGLTGFLRSEVIVPSGSTKGTSTSELSIPLLDRIPIAGETLFEGKPLHYAMFLVVLLTWLVMFRTPWGLRVRSCGENPHAAETLGIDVVKVRYQAVVLGGLIAGMAGAWFSLESQSGFDDNMTNSAGFIALAAMIVGKWTPWGAFGGALLFGYARALGSRLQSLEVAVGASSTDEGFSIPSEFFQMTPYLVTLIVVAGALGRSIAPAAEGQPYSPSK